MVSFLEVVGALRRVLSFIQVYITHGCRPSALLPINIAGNADVDQGPVAGYLAIVVGAPRPTLGQFLDVV